MVFHMNKTQVVLWLNSSIKSQALFEEIFSCFSSEMSERRSSKLTNDLRTSQIMIQGILVSSPLSDIAENPDKMEYVFIDIFCEYEN